MFESMLKKYNAEIFVSEVLVAEVAFDTDVRAARNVFEKGYSVRTLSDKRLGSASSNIFDKKAVEKTISESISASRHTKPMPDSFSFTGSSQRSKVSGTYDKKIARDPIDVASEVCAEALSVASERGIEVTDGHTRAVRFKYRVMNSLGIDKEETGTFVTVMMDAKAKTDKPIAEVPLLYRSRALDKKEYRAWLMKKTRLVSAFVAPEKIHSGTYDILLSPQVFAPMLLDTIGFWASGKARLEETGIFKTLGDKVASDMLSVAIDGTLPAGLSTSSFDAEGNKTSRMDVITRGAFTGYFYDQKYASYFNVVPTGNSVRSSSLGAEKIYAGSPYCGVQNLVVSQGAEKMEDVLQDMKGIFVENVGLAGADPETGAFGFELRNAFIVNKGELSPARYAVLSGSVQDLLKTAALTKETGAVPEPGEGEFSSTCVCPYVFLDKQPVAGGKRII